MKITEEEIILQYEQLGNIWKVGDTLGLTGQYVHSVLTRLGAINKMNYFTKEDEAILKEKYLIYKLKNQLKELAKELKRTPQFISRKANELGLTDHKFKPWCDEKKIEQKDIAKKRIEKYGHPKGMLGKTHSSEFIINCSNKTKKLWEDQKSIFNSEEFRQKKSDIMMLNQANGVYKNSYSRTKSGTITIGGKKIFVRSAWEANIAAYFEFLKNKKEITDWEYEPKTFWFEEIKRGVRSYKPDFLITKNDMSQYWVEVKGWMDDKSKTKIKRFAKYYPNEKMEILDKKRYDVIKKSAGVIKDWGLI